MVFGGFIFLRRQLSSGIQRRWLSASPHRFAPFRVTSVRSNQQQPEHSASSVTITGEDGMTFTLRPDFGKDNCLFPPLPEIGSEATRRQVFTHRSYHARPTHVFEDSLEDPSPDNEKFEHLGDTVLGLTITNLLMDMFPGLRVGPSTKVRAMIVGNPTLAEISMRYKLPDHLRLHPAQAITLRASTNIQADVFESFVGGLYLDQGLEPVRGWITALFTPYARSAYQIARQQHGLPPLPPSFTLDGADRPSNKPTSAAGDTSANTPGLIPSLIAGPHPEPSELINMPTIGHLALFNQHTQKANKQVEWVYSDGSCPVVGAGGNPTYSDIGLPPDAIIKGTKATPVWYVKVLVDGEFFGRGRGNTKKAARNEAAKEGLGKLGIVVWFVIFPFNILKPRSLMHVLLFICGIDLIRGLTYPLQTCARC